MDGLEQELLNEVARKTAEALQSTELRAGSNAFVLAGPITLLRPELVVGTESPLPIKVTGVFRGFYAT